LLSIALGYAVVPTMTRAWFVGKDRNWSSIRPDLPTTETKNEETCLRVTDFIDCGYKIDTTYIIFIPSIVYTFPKKTFWCVLKYLKM
jgi:hypothetical protein